MSDVQADGLRTAAQRGGYCIEGREGGYSAHEWQPVSFMFEMQQLDLQGPRAYRAPDLDSGRVWCVCMKCHKHTYIVTTWAGHWVPPYDFDHGEAGA